MNKPRLKKMRISNLVEDMSLYPRLVVDEVHVRDLVLAIEAEVDLPPVVVDAEGRIVDGVHRHRAFVRVWGAEGMVDVEERSYANDGERFLDAARMNAAHGRKFSRADQVRVIVKAHEFGISDDQMVATALHIPLERVSVLAVRIAIAPGGEFTPTKLGAHHLQGQQLTESQAQTLRTMRGQNTLRWINSLIQFIESGMVPLQEAKVRDRLTYLRDLIDKQFGAEEQAAA